MLYEVITPDLNPTYLELAQHYGVAVIPARVKRPRDKSKVEVGVQVVERWILARLAAFYRQAMPHEPRFLELEEQVAELA